jgi:putative membrane protein
MDIAQAIPLADSWGMHGDDVGVGWLIVMVPMMLLMMGGMMWMMRGMGHGSSSPPNESPAPTDSPVEILERRFAEGEISIEEYRARREALVNGAGEPSTTHEDEPPTTGRAADGGPT